MKTTIKLTLTKSLTVEPCKEGGILATISFSMFGVTRSEALHLTTDQCGALLFGVEQALDVGQQHHNNRAAFEASAQG